MAWWQWALTVWVVFTVLFLLAMARRYRVKTRLEQRAAKHGWWRWKWSQDGWVRQCKICKAVQYGGDDFDGGPDASGHVEA